MPPTTVYLIRHAETTWNAERRMQGTLDAPLSERGIRQVRALVEALRTVPLVEVYTSPLARAQRTARPIADAHHLPLQTAEDLREINQGAWESRLLDEVKEHDGDRLRAWWDSPETVRMPGGENLAEVQARGVRAFLEIAARHPGVSVAVVGHGAVNKAVLLALLDAPLALYWRIRQNNACLNVVEVNGAHARVLSLNETGHLGDDARHYPL